MYAILFLFIIKKNQFLATQIGHYYADIELRNMLVRGQWQQHRVCTLKCWEFLTDTARMRYVPFSASPSLRSPFFIDMPDYAVHKVAHRKLLFLLG